MSNFTRMFKYEVLSPDGPVESADAVSAVIPARDGQVGVLAGRAPLAAVLGPGPLSFERPDGKVREFFVTGGFAQIRNGTLTVLAEHCLPSSGLDHQAALDELRIAREAAARGRGRIERYEDELEAARRKFTMVQRLLRQKKQAD